MSDPLAPIQLVLLLLVAAVGTLLVLTRETRRQALLASFYGLVLALLFFVLQAPDVGLSEIAVGTVAVPLMLLVALSSTRRVARERDRGEPTDRDDPRGERPR